MDAHCALTAARSRDGSRRVVLWSRYPQGGLASTSAWQSFPSQLFRCGPASTMPAGCGSVASLSTTQEQEGAEEACFQEGEKPPRGQIRAAYRIRREPSRSMRRSWGESGRSAGQRSVPSGCGVKAEPGKLPVKEGRAHWGGPDFTGGVCFSEQPGSRVGTGEAPGSGSTSMALANSVVRRSDEESFCPSSRRRFHTHCARIWQNSWPHGVWEYHRSAFCSTSSSASTVSNDPRCRYRSSTSEQVNAGAGRVLINSS